MKDYIPKYDHNNAREFVASLLAIVNLLDQDSYLKKLEDVSNREVEAAIDESFRIAGLDNRVQSILEFKHGLPIEDPEKLNMHEICIELNLNQEHEKKIENEGFAKLITSPTIKERLKLLLPEEVSIAEAFIENMFIGLERDVSEEECKGILKEINKSSEPKLLRLALYGEKSEVMLYLDSDKMKSKYLKTALGEHFVKEATLNQWRHYDKIKFYLDKDEKFLAYIGAYKEDGYFKLKFANTGNKLKKEQGDFNSEIFKKKILQKLLDYDEFKKLPEHIRDNLENNGKSSEHELELYRECLEDDETKLWLEKKLGGFELSEEEEEILAHSLTESQVKIFYKKKLQPDARGGMGTILAYNTLKALNGYMEVWHNYRFNDEGEIICDFLHSKAFEHNVVQGIKPDGFIQDKLKNKTQAYFCFAIPIKSMENFDKMIMENLEAIF